MTRSKNTTVIWIDGLYYVKYELREGGITVLENDNPWFQLIGYGAHMARLSATLDMISVGNHIKRRPRDWYFSTITLHMHHRSSVLMPSFADIEDHCNDQCTNKHYARPIHSACGDRCCKGPGKEEYQWSQEHQCRNIDVETKLSQRPSTWW